MIARMEAVGNELDQQWELIGELTRVLSHPGSFAKIRKSSSEFSKRLISKLLSAAPALAAAPKKSSTVTVFI